MKPNVKSFLAGAVVIALLWAVTALTGGNDSSDAIDPSSSEISAEATDTVENPADAIEPTLDEDQPASQPSESSEPSEPSADESTSSARFSDLPTITPGELPIETIDTLDLIASGGPYPYSKDDTVFQNREGILPDQPRGHYREYTVDTPGENDRGARRIVAGADGALYYTDDHYDSFREIVFGQ